MRHAPRHAVRRALPTAAALGAAGALLGATVAGGAAHAALVAGDITTAVGVPVPAAGGNAAPGFSPDGTPIGSAAMAAPQGLAFDAAGNLFYADTNNDAVRMVPVVDGTYFGKAMLAGKVYTVAGQADGLILPKRVAVDANGNLLIGDSGKADGSASAVYVVFRNDGGSAFGQTGNAGHVKAISFTDSTGSGYTLNDVHGVRVDKDGNLVVADGGLSKVIVRAGSTGTFYGVAMTTGTTYNVAIGDGSGGTTKTGQSALASKLGDPVEAAPDGHGNLVIADFLGSVDVLAGASGTFYGLPMTAGNVYRVAGPANSQPNSVTVAPDGTVTVADIGLTSVEALATDGTLGTIAGNGNYIDMGDGGPASKAQLGNPSAVAEDGNGNILVAEGYENAASLDGHDGNRIREIIGSSTAWPPSPSTTAPGSSTTAPPTTQPSTTTVPKSTTTVPKTTTTTAPATTTTTVPSQPGPPQPQQAPGYWLIARDGGVFTFGAAGYHGSTGGIRLNQPVVGGDAMSDGNGYWLVASDGGVFTFGSAPFEGSLGAVHLNQPVVGMARTPHGQGYWLFARDGGVFTFGDAGYHGSLGNIRLNAPIVGGAPTPSGLGYYLVAADGGVFTFGDAVYAGSHGGSALPAPVVGMAVAPTGGYWLVGADGGVYPYGGAASDGSLQGTHLNQPVVGMAAAPAGGYRLAATDGGVFAFHTTFDGSLGGIALNQPVVGILQQP